MRTLTMEALVEIQIPSDLDLMGYNEEMCVKRPKVRMKLCLPVDNLVLREPHSGRTFTLKRVVIERIDGILLPVVEGDKVVLFDVDEPNQPVTVEGG